MFCCYNYYISDILGKCFIFKGGNSMEEKVVFEDYGIEITDKELNEADKETLLKCKKILLKVVNKVEEEKQ